MTNKELYIQLFKVHSYEWKYDVESTKSISFPMDAKVEKILTVCQVDFDKIQNEIVFQKSNLPFSFFQDLKEYKNEVNHKSLKRDCVINFYKKDVYLWFDANSSISYFNEELNEKNHIFSNSISYFELLDFFEKESVATNTDFEFTDFFSKTTRKITLASIIERKKISFIYPQTGIPDLSFENNYREDFNLFQKLYGENNYYPVFLKNSILSKLDGTNGEVFKDFFDKLNLICKEAKLNFGVYLHNLSLDKIKSDYRDFKKKYYSVQNDILSKISSQIIALPLSIAGSAFAINKLKDSTFGVIAICIGLLLFLVYMSYIISIYWKDLIIVQREMKRDYTLLSEQPFFTDNLEELEYFDEIKSDLNNRIGTLKNSIRIFSVSIWLMAFILTLYAINLLWSPSLIPNLMYTFGFMMIYAGIDNYLIFKDRVEKE